jgi:predicted transcriptional regulator
MYGSCRWIVPGARAPWDAEHSGQEGEEADLVRGFGDLEAAVMDRLWSWARPATVREVLEDLRKSRDLAYTTVMTVMDNLHRKGWLTRELDGRAYRYQPVATRQEYSAELMRQALASSGDEAGTLLRFVANVTPAEAEAIRRALRSRGEAGRQ